MRKKINYLIKHPLISGSFIIFLGLFSSNFINYFFNLIMGRLLRPEEYGLVTSLVSVIILFAVFQTSLGGIFAKFAAKYHAVNDKNSLFNLFINGSKLSFGLSLIILIILSIFFKNFMDFLRITDPRMVLLTYLYIFISIASSLPNGILQGEMRLHFFSFLNIFSAVLKISLGVLFVLMGLKALGAMLGIAIAALMPYLISIVVIYFREKQNYNLDGKFDNNFMKEFRGYTLNFFIATLGMSIFTSVDTILARHFFDPILAGQYAALALMGKSIFYFNIPINFVLFPLVAQRKERKEKVLEVLALGGVIIGFFSITASFFYFLFPNFVLQIFFPKPEYKMLAPYLGPFSLFIVVFSLAFLLNNFLLSLGKTGVYKINILCSLILIILLFMFHSSFFQIIGILFGSSFLLLVLLLIYYWYNGRD